MSSDEQLVFIKNCLELSILKLYLGTSIILIDQKIVFLIIDWLIFWLSFSKNFIFFVYRIEVRIAIALCSYRFVYLVAQRSRRDKVISARIYCNNAIDSTSFYDLRSLISRVIGFGLVIHWINSEYFNTQNKSSWWRRESRSESEFLMKLSSKEFILFEIWCELPNM